MVLLDFSENILVTKEKKQFIVKPFFSIRIQTVYKCSYKGQWYCSRSYLCINVHTVQADANDCLTKP